MKNIKIIPSKLKGEVRIPASKSYSHRAVICAGLAKGVSRIDNLSFSKDITATITAMRSFGVKIDEEENSLFIKGSNCLEVLNNDIDCNESGSTLRFLIPIGATVDEKVTFHGCGKLTERPLDPYYEIFKEQKIEYKNHEGKLPLTIKGRLKPGDFKVRGDISSQFISGLLFALPLLEGDSTLTMTTELESKPYVDLTIHMLRLFSIEVVNRDYKSFYIKGNQKYIAGNYSVEGDFSQAAFWLVAGVLGADINCLGLNIESLQGDKAILEIIKSMGGTLEMKNGAITALQGNTVGSIIDAKNCPDLVPILAVMASLSKGTTKIINATRLRIKESDRLMAMRTELLKLGANIEEKPDGLVIEGKEMLEGGTVSSWNDHRIAMALAIASIKCKEPVIIGDASCVNKSYPGFWEDFKKLGGKIKVYC